MTYAFYRCNFLLSIAVRSASRTSTADPAIAADNRAPVFLIDHIGKRAFDIAAATVGLIVFSPTFLLVTIAIKIDSCGPVFCSQLLHGYNIENIPLLKFRTTKVSATKSTSIVTRVGHVLRRAGIDGLPQLINVLRGEMSIVGPSPCVTLPIFGDHISLHMARPGITGWAQVNGCGGESNKAMRQRIEFDRYYIENWSFLFDIKVILMTLFSKNSLLK